MKSVIWDTAGQERFNAVISSYFRDAHGAFLVYDTTKHTTFEHADNWLRKLRSVSPSCSVVLIGNKCDLATHARQVSLEEAREYAERHDLLFMEASALTSHRLVGNRLAGHAKAREDKRSRTTHSRHTRQAKSEMSRLLWGRVIDNHASVDKLVGAERVDPCVSQTTELTNK